MKLEVRQERIDCDENDFRSSGLVFFSRTADEQANTAAEILRAHKAKQVIDTISAAQTLKE